jgi:hypothetical protein
MNFISILSLYDKVMLYGWAGNFLPLNRRNLNVIISTREIDKFLQFFYPTNYFGKEYYVSIPNI